MGFISEAGKNFMFDDWGTHSPYVGLLTAGTAITSVTGVATTDILTKASHGLSNGNLVVLRSKTGGTGLTEEFPYYVVGVNGNDFQLAKVASGAAVNFTTDISGVSVVKLTEISGGSPAYARKSITWNAAANGAMTASNQPAFDVPAGGFVNYHGYFTADTAGTRTGLDDVTQEQFGDQGTYTVTGATPSFSAD